MCCLPVITYSRTQTKLKGLVAKFDGTKSSKNGAKGVSEDMKRDIPENPKIFNEQGYVLLFMGTPNSTRGDNIFKRSENLEENDGIIFLKVF